MILIIGAGISGLILAQYLHSQSIPFKIFDRDSALDARTGGWGLTLHWALLHSAPFSPPRSSIGSPRPLFDVPAEERIRVNRGRLRELLTTGLDVKWNKTLREIWSDEKGVTAVFEDGEKYIGELLVACDGARSVARSILYPDAKMNPLPVQLLGASTLYSAEEMGGVQNIDPFIFQGSHPETDVFLFFSFLDTPSNFNESSRDRYHVQIIISWADSKGIAVPKENVDRIALMKSLSENWSEPFRSLVHKLPPDAEARSIRIEDWMFAPGRPNLHPRVTLMGDAAHTMTMFRGEGANNAIVDVLDLVKNVDFRNESCFDSEVLATSLEKYEKEIFKRVEPSFLASRQACLDAHDFGRIEGSPLVQARVLREDS
ncbi:hypothetical protein N7532_000089 [Penicillium argentinense]|uniref:FAD-binding domain-containing protein n=1 Tax=Penicillium argentinense TaxID=1131581 RepID=A0A9W9G4J0_9EURO|nr:uncharacterized protein N7532_000089 [Penicillium argentinense]KAJ5112044.1 hypothetical protein N7532_000089 [Penicillium argentinense]